MCVGIGFTLHTPSAGYKYSVVLRCKPYIEGGLCIFQRLCILGRYGAIEIVLLLLLSFWCGGGNFNDSFVVNLLPSLPVK